MKWIVVSFTIFVCFIVTMAEPGLLAKNTFLDQLATHEIVSVLVVLLTITMASVANVHLALSRLNSSLKRQGVDIDSDIKDARKELSSNAWWMFALFCILLVLLLLKGLGPSEFWLSAIHAGVIIIVVINLVVLYDIYVSVYELTALDIDPPIHPGQGEDGSEIGDRDD